MALRKSIDGPQVGEDGAALNAQSLRSLLAKTAAANVSTSIAMPSAEQLEQSR